ncbi:MAG: IS1182 family transposase [Acidobacteria bacterium]|nr:IS1182 family transposase [Acidobacteriota bacterium]
MSKCFREYQPEQALLLPPSLDDWLPEGHLARFISEVVGELDLGPIYQSYEEKDGRGQAAYQPLMMWKVLFYGYCMGIASSRKIEKATYENVAFRYLSANQHPDHDTLAEFRRRHLAALAALFVQVLRLCQEAGLVKLGHVALDGTKIKANASRYRNRTYERLSEQEKELAEQVERMLAEAERTDRAEDQQYGRASRGDELPAELAQRETRLRKIREAKAELQRQARQQAEEKKAEIERRLREREQKAAETGRPMRGKRPAVPDPATTQPKAKAVVNLTDSESRIMREGSSSGFVQGFNAQAAVDGHSQIIVAADVTNQQGDRAQLVPMLEQVEQNLGSKPEKVTADTGYYSPQQVWSPSLAGMDLYVKPDDPPKRYQQRQAAAGDPDPLPRPKRKGRLRCGYDSDGVPRIDPLRAKLASPEGQAIYKKRREVVEPVFGQIKQGRGFRQFLLRSVEKVRAEWRLICLTHNLLKLYRSGWSPQMT